MWVDIKLVALAIGKTKRAVQIRVQKDRRIQRRMKDGRTMELYFPSLPDEWQEKLVDEKAVTVERAMLPALAPAAQEKAVVSGYQDGYRLTSQLVRKRDIAQKIQTRPADVPRSAWVRHVAFYAGVSESTVRRIEKEILSYGINGRPAVIGRKGGAFCPEAIDYLQGFFLKATKEYGSCTKETAWRALCAQADQNGWRIGSRSSAFALLKQIPQALIKYALEGNRGLDNHFYISRDCKALRPMQVIIGDQHIFDWWVADYENGEIYRPQCYLWLDQCTKVVYGIAFDRTYTSDTVKEALRVGLKRCGMFDCTYNDNGSSECSKAINAIVEDLMLNHMAAADISELSRTADGEYVVEDEDGNILASAKTPEEWRRTHRRIFANVRNAKAKDIERFFRTLEGILRSFLLPGAVATPGASAAQDEEERARLEKQKEKRELLTMDGFIAAVCRAIKIYETERVHTTLGMTPWDYLGQRQRQGWTARYMDDRDIDLILFDRRRAKVNRNRVLADNVEYVGEELQASGGRILDVGLHRYEGKTVEVRFDRWNPSYAYAIVPCAENPVRPLKAVEKLTMLDDEAMVRAIASKRRQMAAVREVFKSFTSPVGELTVKSDMGRFLAQAEAVQETMPEATDIDLSSEVRKRLEEPGVQPRSKVTPILSLHASAYDRYRWCQDMIIQGHALQEKDRRFMASYEATEEYRENEVYWTNYRKFGGEA
jgi:putative transposase